ncbi:transposase-like protein [Pullulanibacillus pueri]|uniref:Transposase n=1 Tax=Pullulanibacillus pueri TaxID=1437324 RepID=A0A8J2ZSF2_9BACL|nr:transposase [Pullulanibacillus pueri]MBM7679993.1 transposase-like protein [Pullulanibacillus pueri]GGH73836.1 hypothetical protein GCM10007096_01470 [Pullulanibacillus pueri]
MAKFTLEQKLSAVNDYLQGKSSCISIGEALGTATSVTSRVNVELFRES